MNKTAGRNPDGAQTNKSSDDAGYKADFVAWVEQQTALLRDGHFDELDRENLLEELESMGSNVHHELRSCLIVLLVHLLKCNYQPQRKCKSWFATLGEQRDQIALHLQRSPSLQRLMDSYVNAAYRSAVVRASLETGLPKSVFPVSQPFSLTEVLDLEFIP